MDGCRFNNSKGVTELLRAVGHELSVQSWQSEHRNTHGVFFPHGRMSQNRDDCLKRNNGDASARYVSGATATWGDSNQVSDTVGDAQHHVYFARSGKNDKKWKYRYNGMRRTEQNCR